MDLPPIILSRASETRNGGIALSSALLAVPALMVGHPRVGAVLLAISVVAAAVLLERRVHAVPHLRDVSREGPGPMPIPSPTRAAYAAPRARWEVVERDGQRSLSMRWS